VHYGLSDQVLNSRAEVLQLAFERHPKRFKGKTPSLPKLPKAVWINPPKEEADEKVKAS